MASYNDYKEHKNKNHEVNKFVNFFSYYNKNIYFFVNLSHS